MALSPSDPFQADPAVQFRVRPAQASDEQQLGEVAYQTGFFGHSAAAYFPDPALFADLWVRPYLHGAGAACFVVEGGGRVLGYILGAPDQQRYTSALTQTVLTRVVPALLRRQVRQPLQIARYFLRTLLYPSPHADWEVFPAHLHLNLLPEARGYGLSRLLLEQHLHTLAALGVRGVQLSTTQENEVALVVYKKLGFIEVANKKTAFWQPWLGRSTLYITLARPLSVAESA